MNVFKAVFIDIDNTLLDFDLCGKISMSRSFERVGLEFKDEYFDVFNKINSELWRKIEKGELTRQQLQKVRWKLVFGKLGIDFDNCNFDNIFCECLADSCEPVEGAAEMLEYLSRKYKLYIASNGAEERQKRRLRLAGFYDCFSDIFVSEKMGCEKPNPKFFARALEKIGDILPEEAVFIGDSLTADVSGGKAAGIKTCWFDKYGTGDDKGSAPDFVIRSLKEIKDIL